MKAPHGLRELRERRLLSVNELSKRTGVAHETITRLESGAGNAWPRTLRKLADGLGISYEELYGEPAAPKAAPPRRERPVEPTSAGGSEELAERVREFKQRADKVAREDALQYTAAKLVQDIEGAIHDAEEAGAPEDEIADLAMLAFGITRRIMAAREAEKRTLEEDMEHLAERQKRFAERLGDDRAHNAS